MAEESSYRKAFCVRTGVLRARPEPWACRGAGKRDRGDPPARPGHRDRGGKGMRTDCGGLEGRSRAPCAPPVPDSLELSPAAAPARRAGRQRRVSALLKPSQMPRRTSPVPSGCRLCRGGFGCPHLGQAALQLCPSLLCHSRCRGSPAPAWPAPGKTAKEVRCGPASPAAGAPLLARSYARLRGASPGQVRWESPGGAGKRRQPLCLPSFTKGTLGSSCLFLFVCWFRIWGGSFLVTGLIN